MTPACSKRGEHTRYQLGGLVGASPHHAALVGDVAEAVDVRKPLGGNGTHRLVGDLDDHAVAPEPALQLVGRSLDDHAAVVDDGQPVGKAVRLVEVVRRQQDGQLLDRRQAGDLVPHLGTGLRVEAGGGLVEEEHRRASDETDGDVELAEHAAAVGLGETVGRLGEGEPLEELLRASPGFLAGIPWMRAARTTLSRPVIIGAELDFWEMSPIERRTAFRSRATSCPATIARPESGSASVERILTVVDLPAPLGPSRPKTSP